VDSSIAIQPKRLEPTYITQTYPLSPGSEPKHMITVNWLLNDNSLSAKERMALSVLDDLLLGTSSAVLRKKLIESQVLHLLLVSLKICMSSKFENFIVG
jgi:Zn-dependent M16 (insulinase) family peptidase